MLEFRGLNWTCIVSHSAIGFTNNPHRRLKMPAGCSFLSACMLLSLSLLSSFMSDFFFSLTERHQSAVVSLVVYSQITAKRLSLLVSHKQRAAFYLNGFGGRHRHGGKVTFWTSVRSKKSVTLSRCFSHELRFVLLCAYWNRGYSIIPWRHACVWLWRQTCTLDGSIQGAARSIWISG